MAESSLAYDGAGRLTDLHHTDGSATLARYQYVYDAASRISQITSHVDWVSAFTYDTKNQLTAADHAGSGPPDESYSFDANGNRTGGGHSTGGNNRTTSDGVYDYEYDEPNC